MVTNVLCVFVPCWGLIVVVIDTCSGEMDAVSFGSIALLTDIETFLLIFSVHFLVISVFSRVFGCLDLFCFSLF